MAWRLSEWITAGELDNTVKGWTVGWVKVEGRDEPFQLKLAGNCHRDLSGWKFKIVRVDPIPDFAEPLPRLDPMATNQSGIVGDITADQMTKHFECSPQEFVKRFNAGNPPPTTWRKTLYLEWFSNANGRVVIQSARLAVERQGKRAFELTEEEWIQQAKQNAKEASHFMLQLGDAMKRLEDND